MRVHLDLQPGPFFRSLLRRSSASPVLDRVAWPERSSQLFFRKVSILLAAGSVTSEQKRAVSQSSQQWPASWAEGPVVPKRSGHRWNVVHTLRLIWS